MSAHAGLFGFVLIAGVAVLLAGGDARAQEAIITSAATQPSPGHFTIRHQVRYNRLSADEIHADDEIDDLTFWSRLQYGLTRDLSLSLDVPLRAQFADDPLEDEFGVGDVSLAIKKRVFQLDPGPIDTTRLSLSGGVEIPTFEDPFSSEGFNPFLGAQMHHIRGRHSLSADLQYMFATEGRPNPVRAGDGEADLLSANGAYLYRIAPAEWQADTHGAWYGLVEANWLYETNGDSELLIAPGVMYEARGWTFEASVGLPVAQDVDERPETDVRVVLGVRFVF